MEFYNIEGFSKYLLGKEGDNWSVWRIKKNGELKEKKGSIGERGHIHYVLYSDGNATVKGLHVLIAETFLPIPKELVDSGEQLEVHHIDGNPQNNRIENLCWLTRSEHRSSHMEGNKNMLGKHHSEETKRNISEALKGKPRPQGAGRPQKQVYQYSLDGELIAVWPSTMECGRNGFKNSSVVNCCNGKLNKHKGYRWSYEAPQ